MIIDRHHLTWALFVVVATALVVAGYLANFHPDWLPFQLTLPAFFGPPPLCGSVGSSRKNNREARLFTLKIMLPKLDSGKFKIR